MSKGSNPEVLSVSIQTLRRLVFGLAVVGTGLGVLGIRAAYGRLGSDSAEGHILTTAIVVVSVAVLGVFAFSRHVQSTGKRMAMEDDEQFCDDCFAGLLSSEHHQKCIVPEREAAEREATR
jgi:hypothetical protein